MSAEGGDQVEAAVAAMRQAVSPARLVGIYLYGSAVHGGLRPDSDLDLLVVANRRLTDAEQHDLVRRLMPISGRSTRPASWRPLEVTVVAAPDVVPWRYPPRRDLQYGEWLREAFERGEVQPASADPDLAILVSMVRERGIALIGPPAAAVLDAVPRDDVVRATLDSLPALLGDLADDTRNVLLTLARMWCTLETGVIRTKGEAAAWAVGRLPEAHRPMLERARHLYLAGGHGEWPDGDAVDATARLLADEIRRQASPAG